MTVLLWLTLACSAASIACATATAVRATRTRRSRSLPTFNVAAARRESHALGFAFPEADGKLSKPPPIPAELGQEAHDRLHSGPPVRRAYASGGPVGVFSPREAGIHVRDCRCISAKSPQGWIYLTRDPQCRRLAKP